MEVSCVVVGIGRSMLYTVVVYFVRLLDLWQYPNCVVSVVDGPE
jgi:hypothetical protein